MTTAFMTMCMFLLTAGVPEVVSVTDISPVWAGHPVGFCLYTHGDVQLIGFYDAGRRMTVGKRHVDDETWHLVRLPESVGWDSHNYITLTVDDNEHIHLSGNMHVTPLVYFRTTRPLDIDSFERMPMVGEREDRTTYPKFLRGASGELLFCYRDGSSGDGEELYNVFDHTTQQWRRFLETPLVSGQGLHNAYIIGPEKGPDNRFHICWVWREHSGCESNHNLSYAVSPDLRRWETGGGREVTLPMTLDTADIVDPVPPGGGIINGNTRLGFDAQQRPVISYHKFDDAGYTQVYNARLENGVWVIYQTSDWDYRWDFSGGGTIIFEIRVSGVSPHGEGQLRQPYSHTKLGSGIWLLDETNFRIVGAIEEPSAYPPEHNKPLSDFPGMEVRRAGDSGHPAESGIRYYLQWETLPQNRDRRREGNLPEPSMLRLFKVSRP